MKKSASILRSPSSVTEAISPLSCMLDVDDLAFGPLDAVLLGKAAQIFGVERGVEVEGVGDMADRRIPPCRRAHA